MRVRLPRSPLIADNVSWNVEVSTSVLTTRKFLPYGVAISATEAIAAQLSKNKGSIIFKQNTLKFFLG